MTAVDLAEIFKSRVSDSEQVSLLIDIVSASEEGILCWSIDPPIDTRLPPPEQLQALREGMQVSYCNQSYARLMDYPGPEDIIGRNVIEFLGELNVDAKLQEMVENDYRLERIRFPFKDSGGNTRLTSVTTHALLQDQMLIGIWNTVLDATRQSEQESEAEIIRELLSDSQELARIGSWSEDFRTGRRAQSRQLHILMGLPPRPEPYDWTDFLEKIHPDDRARVAKGRERTRSSGDTSTMDFRVVEPDGSLRYFHTVVRSTLDKDGQPLHWLGTMQEITEQVKLREQLQEMVEARTHALSEEIELRKRDAAILKRQAVVVSQISEAVIVWNLDLKISDWNDGATKVFGYSREEVMDLGPAFLRPRQPLAPSKREELLDWIEDNDGWQGELPYQHKDGHEVICEASLTALRDSRGNIISFVEVVRDATERKAYEHKLADAKEEAEQANVAKSHFIRGLSHELRTPLNAILGFAQLMERLSGTPLDSQQQDYLDHIQAGGVHLLGLVNEVLDLAKIESGEIDLKLEAVDCKALAEEVLQLVAPQAEERGITPALEVRTERSIHGDYMRLKQVLLNLLTNGIKYNSNGGGLYLSFADSDSKRVRIMVTDTGPGIDPGRYDELFEPFNRLGVTDATVEGTGLGLPITASLVEAMAGTMGVDSQPGEGSSFWVDLPAAEN